MWRCGEVGKVEELTVVSSMCEMSQRRACFMVSLDVTEEANTRRTDMIVGLPFFSAMLCIGLQTLNVRQVERQKLVRQTYEF